MAVNHRIIAKTSLPLFSLLALTLVCSCGGTVTVAKAQAATNPDSVFSGRYTFKSSGYFNGGTAPFVEAGTIIADGAGHYELFSDFNAAPNVVRTFHSLGTYHLNQTFMGDAQQTDQSCGCPGPTDVQSLTLSQDGKHGYMVSRETTAVWLAELVKE